MLRYNKDIKSLYHSGLSGRNYEDKLKELRLESLEKRRIYIDMLQTFKIIHGFDDVKSDTWFNTVGSGEHRLTRLTADPLNLMSSRSRLELELIFFSQRLVNLWKSLPREVKNARNPKMLKKEDHCSIPKNFRSLTHNLVIR